MEERSFFYRYCIIIPTSFPKLIEFLEKSLKEYDFDIQSFEEKKSKYICISQTNEQRLLNQAENLKIKKPIKKLEQNEIQSLDQRIIDLESKDYFIAEKYKEYFPSKEYNEFYNAVTKNNKKDDTKKRYGLGLFTESEMLNLEKSILENIPITNREEFDELIATEYEKNSSSLLKNLNIKSNKKILIEENSLFNTFINHEIIKDSFPLHISNFNKQLSTINFGQEVNPNLIRSYFNDELALYFSWLCHFTKYIFFPAVLTAVIYIICRINFKGKNADLLHIFQTFIITFWTQIFIVFWYKKETAFKILWDNDSKEYDKADERKEYIINNKADIIDNNNAEQSKIKRYLNSFGVTLIFFCIATYFNIVLLNIRNLIPEDRHQFLVIQKYKKQREKGYSSPWYVMMGRIFAISFLDSIYDSVNKGLTDKENHRTKTQYYNSYIIKKFIFESYSYFFEIFYVSLILNNPVETSRAIKFYFYTGKYFRLIYELIVKMVVPFFGAVLFMKDESEVKEGENKKKIKKEEDKKEKENEIKEEIKKKEEIKEKEKDKEDESKEEIKEKENEPIKEKEDEPKEEIKEKENDKKDEPKEEEDDKKNEPKKKGNEEGNDEKRFLLGLEIDKKEVIKQSGLSQFKSFSEYYPFIKDFCLMTVLASSAYLGPILVYINNSFNIQGNLKKFSENKRRPEVYRKKNIGGWKYIIESIGIMSIITNIMFCYSYKNTFGENNYFLIGEIVVVLIIISFRLLFSSDYSWIKTYKLRKISDKKID